MARKEISAAEALKAFRGKSITVQTATPARVKGEDGKERSVFKTSQAPLREEHVIGAARYDDGRVTIVTCDCKRHEAAAGAAAA